MESKLALGISIILHDLVLNWTLEKLTLQAILELLRSSCICPQLYCMFGDRFWLTCACAAAASSCPFPSANIYKGQLQSPQSLTVSLRSDHGSYGHFEPHYFYPSVETAYNYFRPMFVYVNNYTLLRLWKEIPLIDSFHISLGLLLFPSNTLPFPVSRLSFI